MDEDEAHRLLEQGERMAAAARASAVTKPDDLFRPRPQPQRESDRLIIRAMRMAIYGMAAIILVFVIFIVSNLYIASRDNRRLDEIDRRLRAVELERR